MDPRRRRRPVRPLGTLLGATTATTVATGILNLWMHTAGGGRRAHRPLTAEHGRRFLCGIGVSHRPLIDAVNAAGTTANPIADRGLPRRPRRRCRAPLPATDRVLAALGPKMLELARTRAGGTHPYLVTPEHTAIGTRGHRRRPAWSPPSRAWCSTTDPTAAREIARAHLATYLGLPELREQLEALGFTDDDIADGGSDRLVDALVAWGDEAAIAARVQAHRDAGADHVCVQVLTDDLLNRRVDEWRTLAPALLG